MFNWMFHFQCSAVFFVCDFVVGIFNSDEYQKKTKSEFYSSRKRIHGFCWTNFVVELCHLKGRECEPDFIPAYLFITNANELFLTWLERLWFFPLLFKLLHKLSEEDLLMDENPFHYYSFAVVIQWRWRWCLVVIWTT